MTPSRCCEPDLSTRDSRKAGQVKSLSRGGIALSSHSTTIANQSPKPSRHSLRTQAAACILYAIPLRSARIHMRCRSTGNRRHPYVRMTAFTVDVVTTVFAFRTIFKNGNTASRSPMPYARGNVVRLPSRCGSKSEYPQAVASVWQPFRILSQNSNTA